MEYKYDWLPGTLVSDKLLRECANLYSNHYGIWGAKSQRSPGSRIKLSPDRIREWLILGDAKIALAYFKDELIGYAIAVQTNEPKYGTFAWVTQLVVHEEHRQKDVGKTLLFSIWSFSDHFAWGLLSSNPYAIRALEKATRRRCLPIRISKNWRKLFNVGVKNVPYVTKDTQVAKGKDGSKINTKFFVDHSNLQDMIADVTTEEKPWLLGTLEEGWEWFAFTFKDQEQIGLTSQEIKNMLDASDQISRRAYSRMKINNLHLWARHANKEAQLIAEYCQLEKGQKVIGMGCGGGRHANALGVMGFNVTGIGYIKNFIDTANEKKMNGTEFFEGDCRNIDLGRKFDAAICLYDVVETYADNSDNILILENIARHLKPSGRALISVMNFELTKYKAKHTFSLKSQPNKLLDLQASRIMEQTGDVFNPDYYLIDMDTRIVYRKEQFATGYSLPAELIVRDRRFCKEEIELMCKGAGLEVIWSRFVSSGNWDKSLPPNHEKAKEILVLCKKSA